MAHTIASVLLSLTGLSLIYILYVTIKGRPVGRRVVFIYIAIATLLPLFMKLSPPINVTNDVQTLVNELKSLPPQFKSPGGF